MIVHSIIKCDNSYTQEMENSHIVATLVGAKITLFTSPLYINGVLCPVVM